MDNDSFAKLIVVLLLIVCGAAFVANTWTNEDDSRRALEQSGFTDIEIIGHAWFACSESDTFSTAFRATNARGAAVSGAVCCGLLKNCTVRF